MATHYDIVRCAEVATTQDVANDRFSQTARATLVVADRQVAGRGRQGRTWLEPDRGMFSSLASSSGWESQDLTLVPLCAAVSVAEAVADEVSVGVDLKWPNDLLVEGRKIGGILVEASGTRITVGCGVNLWWADPPPFASAVFAVDPGADAAERLAIGWVDRLLDALARPAAEWPRDAYVERCVTLGSEVEWSSDRGVATGIGSDGALMVETAHGQVEVRQGDVHLSGNG